MKNILFYILLLIFGLQSFSQSEILTEEILLKNDSIKLPGTLSYHKNIDKQPLVIFIHGSGNVDRNGNQKPFSNANYIKLLAEKLNHNHIAFYRYDKRTSNLENSKYFTNGIVIEDFVKDLNLAINHFKNDHRFSSINLIGHSQGSLVGMLSELSIVNKYISLAGPAEPIDKALYQQVKQNNGDSIAKILKSHLDELKLEGKIEKVDSNLLGLLNPVNQIFIKSWMTYDPKKEISKIKIPVLILNGNKDLQVKPNDAEVLHKANKNSKLKIIDNMNHVLKTISDDKNNLKSYSNPDFPLSTLLVNEIVSFINSN